MCAFEGCDKEVRYAGYCAAHYNQLNLGKELKPLQIQYHGLSEYERLLKWTDVKGVEDCWDWLGSRHKKMWHGQWRNGDGNIELAHRAAWRLMRGPIPTGLCVLHRCDNPSCLNPKHLFLGTRSDNTHDMWDKGRARPKSSKGEKHGCAKLTDELVRDIRSSKESGVELARRLSITQTTICDIRKRRTWKHIV